MTATGYTTLEHLKRSLNNGELPVMTPVAEKAKAFIDPAFVLGQGGLQEDSKRGLRCPVRGCGGFHHNLASHWTRQHAKTIGPVAVLREVLSLKPKTPLWSAAARSRASENVGPQLRARWPKMRSKTPTRQSPVFVEKRIAAYTASVNSMETRNLRNSCDAQLRKRYNDCRDRLGREPMMSEFDNSFQFAVQRHYGSLNAFRATIGISAMHGKRPSGEDNVLAALEAWHKAHGKLPNVKEAMSVDRTPYLPSPPTILRTLGIGSWPVAMSHVAWLLGIDDPNYSPKKSEAA